MSSSITVTPPQSSFANPVENKTGKSKVNATCSGNSLPTKRLNGGEIHTIPIVRLWYIHTVSINNSQRCQRLAPPTSTLPASSRLQLLSAIKEALSSIHSALELLKTTKNTDIPPLSHRELKNKTILHSRHPPQPYSFLAWKASYTSHNSEE